MIVNFDIENNYALIYEDKHIDLHNNFDFVGFEYNIKKKELRLTWTKSNGDWVNNSEIGNLILIHSQIDYLTIIDRDENKAIDDNSCLGEITYFPSTERQINDSFMSQARPNDEDDILYLFENGLLIRVHCDKIELFCID